ncbi:hypothetical protein LCGC14_0141620 [marine sediment metagenome]|uniref:Uncharacterized protein n=1 Tax=marine sediment metagenome TaxID=412755 RepID=A0A0F9VGG3_9ZZZZ
MARVGPNQDINDPTTIIDVAYQYQQQSNDFGDLLAQSLSQNPNATGDPIVDIVIPLRMEDGSTQFIRGVDISFSDNVHSYDTTLVASANILTYIDLAERFREYWNTLNNVVDQVNDFDYTIETTIDPIGPTVSHPGTGQTRTHGSLGGTEYNEYSYTYSPLVSLSEPTWHGFGPTDYNQITYPELLSQLSIINLTRSLSSLITWETNYWYDKFSDSSGSLRSGSARFTKHEQYAPPISQQYIQFYNSGDITITISISMSIVSTFDTRFAASIASWAEIDDLNVYPNPFAGTKSLLSSYIIQSQELLSPGGTISLSDTRDVDIPPGKSAFVGCFGSSGTTFGGVATVGTISVSLTLEDETITHAVSVV